MGRRVAAGDVAVSWQHAGGTVASGSATGRSGNAAVTHLAWGVLTGPDVVVVPHVPRSVVEDPPPSDVVVLARAEGLGTTADRIPVTAAELHQVRGTSAPVVAVLHLARAAAVPPTPARRRVLLRLRRDGLRLLLPPSPQGDLLRGLGVGDLAPGRDPAVLDELALPPAPAARGVPGLVMHPDIDDLAFSICRWVPWCHPLDPWWLPDLLRRRSVQGGLRPGDSRADDR